MNNRQPIGIFDSGLGGISVLKELRLLLPHEHFIYYGDSAHAPYGIKEKAEITARCIEICDYLIDQGVKAIVIACNTATSACVNLLRKRYSLPIIGMEPALKVAAEQGEHQRIIVTATPLTLKEQKFARLMERFQDAHTIYRQPCPRLVEIVEHDQLDNRELVIAQLNEYLYPYDLSQIDSIVLGCTHFVFFKDYFRELLPSNVHIIDGNHGTAMHLMDLLRQRDALCEEGEGSIRIENSSGDQELIRLSKKLLGGNNMNIKNAWETYSEQELQEVFALSEEYKQFISENKTERMCVSAAVAMAKAKGYRDLREVIAAKETLSPQDKVYLSMMDKSIVLFHIGNRPIEEGMHILGAHIDSPRLDLKQNPLYENSELSYLDTHYYGGIKKYQWVTLPLALHGVIVKKDGTKVEVHIGEKDDDPVFVVSDLLVHLSGDQMQKKASNVIEGEDLNVTFGSMPLKEEEKDKVKANILRLLKESYDVEEDDFVSAEIEVVPAGKARDLGLDRSMVIGYGQDDRVCAFTSLKAILEMEQVEKTAVCLLVDKEEVGSQGATGMQSRFFENALAEVMDRLQDYSELKLRRALQHSKMLSSDVSAAFDPNYAGVMETNNCAYFGKGIVFNKYTGARGKSGCNDANAEYLAELRAIMEKGNVKYQTSELGKVDQGGGGTIAYILANYGMEVIDSGVALHNMHAPWEVSSKADIYEAKKGYLAFLKYAD